LTGQQRDIPLEEERQLMLAIAAGDSKSFRTLVDIFWSRGLRQYPHPGQIPQTAEEITQDIFLKIWQQKERLAEVQSFKHYIYVVGRTR